MDELVANGAFAGLFELGAFSVSQQYYSAPIATYSTDQNSAKEFEVLLDFLENTADCNEYADECLSAFVLLQNGLLCEPDEDRAHALLRHFLYNCTQTEIEDKIVNQMHRWEETYPRIFFELAVFNNENLHPDKAAGYAKKALNNNYLPADEYQRQMNTEAKTRLHLAKKTSKEPALSTGYDVQKARRGWAGKTMANAFSEKDLYLKTECVVARARPNGNIYIRFLIEGEAGYGQALDFVNALLEKGYSRISGGWSGGFALHVRFLIEPVYISQMEGTSCNDDEIYFPNTSCHAFFARAVHYPELRQRVVHYAERALDRFTCYLDLPDENNTVPGTFAAIALAFCGKEYFPIVEQYANATDDEHTYLLSLLMLPLVEHYDNDPDLASAVFDIACCSNTDDAFKLSKELIWNPQFIAKLLAYGGAGKENNSRLEDFANACERIYGDNGEGVHKKIVKLANSSPKKDQQVFVDFHNTYIAAMSVLDMDDYFSNINPIVTKADSTTLDHQQAVISKKEAKQRGYKITETFEEKAMLFFSPVCVLSDETISYIRQQYSNIGRENSKEMYHRCCFMLLQRGPNCTQYGNWVINSRDYEFECGVVLFGGKGKKPVILYGELDSLTLGAVCDHRWPKAPEDLEALRQQFLLKPSAARRTDDAWRDAEKLLDKKETADSFFSEWHSCLSKRMLERITPDQGDIAYLSCRMMLVYLAARRGDAMTLAKLCDELTKLQPEKALYWKEKAEIAKAVL